jgi:cell division septal protein FtsQ
MAGARGSFRRELVSRLFGPRNRRRGSSEARTKAPRLRGPAGAVAGVALAVVLWPPVRDAVCRHPYFAVREVIVRGQEHLSPEAIRRFAGLEPGMSIWEVDGRAAAARLLEEPWVRSAEVRRELPHRVLVQVREERPVAILTANGSKPGLYYVSSHGRIFAQLAQGDPRDFPYLTGFRSEDLDGEGAFGPHAMRRALALLRATARGAGSVGRVSEIHVDRRRGLVLLPMWPTVPIEVGWDRFAEKLARVPRILELWNGREAELAGVSLLFEDEVIVRTVAAGGAPKRGAAGA